MGFSTTSAWPEGHCRDVDVRHKREVAGPAQRFEKVEAEAQPKVGRAEVARGALPVAGQLVALTEFEQVVEAKVIVELQPQTDGGDWSDGGRQQAPRRAAIGPRGVQIFERWLTRRPDSSS